LYFLWLNTTTSILAGWRGEEREGRNYSSFRENGLAGALSILLDRRGAVEKFGELRTNYTVLFGWRRAADYDLRAEIARL